MPAFSELEVTLYLLRRMADLQEPLVEDALRRLGSSKAEMRAANKRWNAVAFGRPGRLRVARFERSLGAPVVDRRVPPEGTAILRSCWPLSLWPDLWLQVLADEQDAVWHLGLTRALGAPRPALGSIGDVAPWSCTLAECAEAFEDVTFLDVGLTGHEAISCTTPEGRFRIRSVWGLVQTTAPA